MSALTVPPVPRAQSADRTGTSSAQNWGNIQQEVLTALLSGASLTATSTDLLPIANPFRKLRRKHPIRVEKQRLQTSANYPQNQLQPHGSRFAMFGGLFLA